ncbi:hypothetical protein MTR67_023292 [Solanum verrucosum]|uniref:Uncharacterized protein n=1 Tax=Solanum verrucosum TaxID=315347 RepID=A0AAF0QT82_SOLVR|nr:hypothetical protein MTR67_023292 [Solanum verrucosum]
MAKIQDIQVQQQEKDRPIWGSKARVPSQARSCMSKWSAEAISWKIARLAYEADVENQIIYQGGSSFGCPTNAGAAGTFYDAVPRRLIVNNHNLSTDTDTLLFEFPNHPLWTNIYIQDHARATVPLLWSRLQVRGQLSLSHGAILSFGLVHYALSEFELLAEELLMSDSVIKASMFSSIYGSLRMSVKIQLMLNSKMLIDGDGDAIVATSLLEMSNLVVLKGSSVIQSNANLGVHGQGSLNLTGPGDTIEAQHLVLSLFYSINSLGNEEMDAVSLISLLAHEASMDCCHAPFPAVVLSETGLMKNYPDET